MAMELEMISSATKLMASESILSLSRGLDLELESKFS